MYGPTFRLPERLSGQQHTGWTLDTNLQANGTPRLSVHPHRLGL